MFKKIALLAGAGALAFGAVAPMAAAAQPTDPEFVSECSMDSVNYWSGQLKKTLKESTDAGKSKQDASDEVDRLNQIMDDNRESYRNNKEPGKTLYTDAEGKLGVPGDAKTHAGATKAYKEKFDAEDKYTRSLKKIADTNKKVSDATSEYMGCVNKVVLRDAVVDCNKWVDNVQQLVGYKNNLKKAIENAKSELSISYPDLPKDILDNLKPDNRVLGEQIKDAKGKLADADKKIKEFQKKLAAKCNINVTLKDIYAEAMKHNAKDQSMNNAAAKEGKGLAATGSAASVAALLSALAVLAGGAFVGIRRFNS